MAGPSAFMNTPSAFNGQAPHPAAAAAAALARASAAAVSVALDQAPRDAASGNGQAAAAPTGAPRVPAPRGSVRPQLESVQEDSQLQGSLSSSPHPSSGTRSLATSPTPGRGSETTTPPPPDLNEDDGDVSLVGSDRRRSSGRHARYTEQKELTVDEEDMARGGPPAAVVS